MDKNVYCKITSIITFSLLIGILMYVSFYHYSQSGNLIKAVPKTTNVEDAKLSIEFAKFKESKQNILMTETTASFIAVGDISFSRGVERMVKFQKDINFPFYKTKDILSDADITFANLETPITPGQEIPNGSMTFRSNPGMENALKWAGIDIVNLANNHTYNYGQEGLQDTFKFLSGVGISYVGAGNNITQAYAPLIVEKNGIKFAILSYEAMDIVPPEYEASLNKPGIAFMRIEKMQEAVKKAKSSSEVVIVTMHAGEEYVPVGNDLQTNFAHAAIDAGADLVLGAHPHVIQNAEIYKEKMIFYSLGNFIMDQMWSEGTRQVLIFKGIFSKNGLEKFYLIPAQIEQYSQPNPVFDTLADSIVKKLQLTLQHGYTVSYDKTKKTYVKMPHYMYETSLGDATKALKTTIPAEKNIFINLNQNPEPESIILKNGQIQILAGNRVIWESPNNWWVDDVLVEKSLNDGRNLINMSVWKEGNFGDSKPLWVKENDNSIKNHLFVLALENNKIKYIWQSSNLPVPNCKIEFKDIESDGSVELIAYEGSYENTPRCNTTNIAVFKWKEWGFYNEWRESIN